MSEVLVEFDTTVVGEDGRRWMPQVCGRVADDGLWEGWIEFAPTDPSEAPVRTRRETEQSKRDDLMYWAQGLTQMYLEEALRRAMATPPVAAKRGRDASPFFDAPASRSRPDATASVARPILDPFEVYAQGEAVLIRQLSALDAARLRDIAVAHGFVDVMAAASQSRDELTAAIVAAVRPRGLGPPAPIAAP